MVLADAKEIDARFVGEHRQASGLRWSADKDHAESLSMSPSRQVQPVVERPGIAGEARGDA